MLPVSDPAPAEGLLLCRFVCFLSLICLLRGFDVHVVRVVLDACQLIFDGLNGVFPGQESFFVYSREQQ